jgi:ribosomal protein S5
LGSPNVLNIATATLKGLRSLTRVEEEAARRGKDSSDLLPFWERK